MNASLRIRISRAFLVLSITYRRQVRFLAPYFDSFFPHIVTIGIHCFFLYIAVMMGRTDFFILGILALMLSLLLSFRLEAKGRGYNGLLDYILRFDRRTLASFLEFVFYPPFTLLYGAISILLVELAIPLNTPSTLISDVSAVFLALLVSFIVFSGTMAAKDIILTHKNIFTSDSIFSISGISAALTILGFGSFQVINTALLVGSLGVLFVIIVGSIARRFIRVSGHMLVLSFTITGLFILFDTLGAIGYLLLLPVMWCRLYLRRHTPLEVFSGTALGVLVPLAGNWLLKSLILFDLIS